MEIIQLQCKRHLQVRTTLSRTVLLPLQRALGHG